MQHEKPNRTFDLREREKYWVSTVKHDGQHKYHQVRKIQSGVREVEIAA